MTVAAHRVAPDGNIGAAEDSPLTVATTHLEPGESVEVADASCDTLFFAFGGAGALARDSAAHPCASGAAMLVPAGTEAMLTAGASGLSVVQATIGAGGVDLHAPMGAAETTTTLDAVEPGRATGARSFQVLFGPHNGCVRATLFVGYIPSGKAPWHYHLYDEIVWVLHGRGQLHVRDAGVTEGLDEGCAFRLRPREVHVVENLLPDRELAVLGLFTPAGSPSAAYLEAGVLADYGIVSSFRRS